MEKVCVKFNSIEYAKLKCYARKLIYRLNIKCYTDEDIFNDAFIYSHENNIEKISFKLINRIAHKYRDSQTQADLSSHEGELLFSHCCKNCGATDQFLFEKKTTGRFQPLCKKCHYEKYYKQKYINDSIYREKCKKSSREWYQSNDINKEKKKEYQRQYHLMKKNDEHYKSKMKECTKKWNEKQKELGVKRKKVNYTKEQLDKKKERAKIYNNSEIGKQKARLRYLKFKMKKIQNNGKD